MFCLIFSFSITWVHLTAYPGNVQWAYVHGTGSLQAINAELALMVPPGPVLPLLPLRVETHMISFYSDDTGNLADDSFSFFEFY